MEYTGENGQQILFLTTVTIYFPEIVRFSLFFHRFNISYQMIAQSSNFDSYKVRRKYISHVP